jgi:hypothetical protein
MPEDLFKLTSVEIEKDKEAKRIAETLKLQLKKKFHHKGERMSALFCSTFFYYLAYVIFSIFLTDWDKIDRVKIEQAKKEIFAILPKLFMK